MFVADDLGGWLVGLLADASRKKLITTVLGTDQERALRTAAKAAARLTAQQLCPGDDKQAELVTLVIRQVFSEQVPEAPLARHETLLEMLETEIAAQLAVLGDASVTGTGQSSADVLKVPATVLTEILTTHLLRQITSRGARGGPLETLANQLSHDKTYLQGQRIADKLDRLAATAPVSDLSGVHGSPLPPVASWPLVAETDPLIFGVHRARSVGQGDSLLPPYISRDIDGQLREQLIVAGERGGLVLLIGDSTAGKTRTAFEAMRRLLADHRVLAPPRDADLGFLPRLLDSETVRTLLWLDDLESYLRPRGLDQIVLGKLVKRRMAILATMGAEQYEAYLPHARSVQFGAPVLNLVEPIQILRLWSTTELDRVAHQKDERLLEAAAHHSTFGIAEYLAAGPPLLLEWRQASRVSGHPRGAALVSAAVDLARIGIRGPVTEVLLRRVHEDYLTRAGGAALRPEPFSTALTWAAQVRYGATSLLIPGELEATWRPFDYLVDAVVREADDNPVPNTTWEALLGNGIPEADLFAVGVAAYSAGQRGVAETAWRPLAEAGSVWAMYNLGCLFAETEEITALVEWFHGGSGIFMAEAERADEAEVWWRRAAENGHVESMHNLSVLLFGKGKHEEGQIWEDRANARSSERRLPLPTCVWRLPSL